MDKELINNTNNYIIEQSKYFIKYLEQVSEPEVISFIHEISKFAHVYIFSGVIRNFFLEFNEKARDIDIVYQGDDLELNLFLKNYNYKINSFNGYKILIGKYSVDLWKVESTWAIKNEKLRLELFDQYVLPKSTFFNFSSILFDYNNKNFINSLEFTHFLETKVLDLVLEENPLPQLCIINTLYYKEKFKLKISEKLKKFCILFFNRFSKEDFDSIQLKHFKLIKYSYEDIKENINIFKMTGSLLEELNLANKEELYYYIDLFKDERTKFLNSRVKETLIKLSPIAFFCIKNEPLILFFNKHKDFSDLDDLEIKIWNYNKSPIIFINDGEEWVIKNGFKLLNNRSGLDRIQNAKMKDFDYFEIITGKTWDKYKNNFNYENRVDYFLLNNITEFREKLISKEYNLDPKIANSLIGRSIFIRYLIDRKINLHKYSISNQNDLNIKISNKEECYFFFEEILKDFGEDLFPLKYNINGETIYEKDLVNQSHLSLLIELLQGGKLTKEGTLLSLFDLYDFSIIPIEFISSIYERFIGSENQAIKGAYYTPLFLVDFIEKETIGNYFQNNKEEFNCRVLDPACGSGVFLVETLRLIINQFLNIYPEYKNNQELYKDVLKKIVTHNIFGVDKDENAVKVAIFSIYITLLDNLESKSISEFKLPELLNKNLFVADFFDLNANFNDVLNSLSFQFIIGNPPWKTKHSKEKQLFEDYIVKRRLKESSNLEIENREIAEAFLVRLSDFKFGQAALIVTSKILYKVSRRKNKGGFRKYFLNKFLINKVVELSSVRQQIFNQSSDSAVAPATILFYKKIENENSVQDNLICHISIKPNIFFEILKIIVIEKFDIKYIVQKKLFEDDWLWKVLVYGNVLDYDFIKKFKKTKPIFDYISNERNFIFGKGISIGGGDKNNIQEHKKILYSVNSKQKGLKPFIVEYSESFLENLEFVHRPRRISLFRAPVLLVGKGITNDFKAKAAISYNDVLYTDAITGIKPISNEGKEITYTLEGLFNSDLFSYFLVQTNSSIGIEREQAHDKEDKFSIPLIIDESKKLKYYSDKIRELFQLYNNVFFDSDKNNIQKEILNYEKEINNFLLKLYKITPQEKSLINYTNEITIPLLKGTIEKKKKVISKIRFNDSYLLKYINVFNEYLYLKKLNLHTEIFWSDYVILINFKIVNNKNNSSTNWKIIDNSDLIFRLIKMGFKNISENLFLNKEIKGFEYEDNSFYIVKPNEFKLWHEAIAYYDLAEFENNKLKTTPQK